MFLRLFITQHKTKFGDYRFLLRATLFWIHKRKLLKMNLVHAQLFQNLVRVQANYDHMLFDGGLSLVC